MTSVPGLFSPRSRERRKSRLAAALAVLLSGPALLAAMPAATATPASAEGCPAGASVLPAGPLSQVVDALTPRQEETVLAAAGLSDSEPAGRGGETGDHLDDHAADASVHIDSCGMTYFVDEERSTPELLLAESAAPAEPVVGLDETFSLHSRPGAARTIFLNFQGASITGTAWNSSTALGFSSSNPGTLVIQPYSIDSDTSQFSQAELASIQELWSSVAEDFAPFAVDVTTQRPPLSALRRDHPSDQTYGITMNIGAGGSAQSACSCGGVAWLNTFGLSGTSADTYAHAFAFTEGAGRTGEYLAGTISHESGHTLGLRHDGTSTLGYYRGARPWSTIMGAGSGPVSQWSRGEYPDANNTEDDLALIGRSLPTVPDDHGDTVAQATRLQAADLGPGAENHGVITSAEDVDLFRFSTAGGPTRVHAEPRLLAGGNPNLDLAITVRDAEGGTVAVAAPRTLHTTLGGLSGMDATWSGELEPGTYVVEVAGSGNGDPAVAGQWSAYGSLGRYRLTVETEPGEVEAQPLTASFAPMVAVVGEQIVHGLTAQGGTGKYRWEAVDPLPDGLRLDADGVISGELQAPARGSHRVRVTSGPASLEGEVTLVVSAGAVLGVELEPTIRAEVGRTVRRQILLDDPNGLDFTFTGDGLPDWATVSASGLVSLTAPSTGTHALRVRLEVAGRSQAIALLVEAVEPTAPLVVTAPGSVLLRGEETHSSTLTSSGGVGRPEWSLVSGPEWVRVTRSGVLTVAPPKDLATSARHTYRVRAESGTESQTVTGQVVHYRSRYLDLEDLTVSARAGETASVTLQPRRLADERLTYRLVDAPGWAGVSAAGLLHATPPASGRHPITVEVQAQTGVPSRPGYVQRVSVVFEAAAAAVTSPPPAPSTPSTPTTPSTPSVTRAADLTVRATAKRPVNGSAASGSGLTWSLESGRLPSGVSLRADGRLVGSPRASGTFRVSVRGASGTARVLRTVTIVVAKPVVLASSASSMRTVGRGRAVGIRVTASKGTPSFRFTRSGSLPRGMRFAVAMNGRSATVSGRPQRAGTYLVRLRVRDANGSTAAKTFRIRVR